MENQSDNLFLEIGRGRESYWHRARREILHKLLMSCYTKSPSSARLLDVGCGMGYELDFFQKRLQKTEMLGMDISLGAVKFGKENYKGYWCQGSATQVPFNSQAFDILMCLDVLEHLEDDKAILRECNRVCKPGGLLVVSVPACKFLWSAFDDLVSHKRRYYKNELADKLKEANFEIQRISYAFFTFLPILFLARGLKKVFVPKKSAKEKAISELKKPNFLIDAIMYLFLKPEIMLSRKVNFPIGSSLMCVAKKLTDSNIKRGK